MFKTLKVILLLSFLLVLVPATFTNAQDELPPPGTPLYTESQVQNGVKPEDHVEVLTQDDLDRYANNPNAIRLEVSSFDGFRALTLYTRPGVNKYYWSLDGSVPAGITPQAQEQPEAEVAPEQPVEEQKQEDQGEVVHEGDQTEEQKRDDSLPPAGTELYLSTKKGAEVALLWSQENLDFAGENPDLIWTQSSGKLGFGSIALAGENGPNVYYYKKPPTIWEQIPFILIAMFVGVYLLMRFVVYRFVLEIEIPYKFIWEVTNASTQIPGGFADIPDLSADIPYIHGHGYWRRQKGADEVRAFKKLGQDKVEDALKGQVETWVPILSGFSNLFTLTLDLQQWTSNFGEDLKKKRLHYRDPGRLGGEMVSIRVEGVNYSNLQEEVRDASIQGMRRGIEVRNFSKYSGIEDGAAAAKAHADQMMAEEGYTRINVSGIGDAIKNLVGGDASKDGE